MGLATEQLKDPYYCDDCGYYYFTTTTDTYIEECPQCGPAAKQRMEQRRKENQIRRINEKLQAGIYE